jgi:hypothetical protein
MKSPTTLLLVLAATGFTKTNADPVPPQLTHLLTANVTAGPSISIGTEVAGTRVVYPITGGTFAGPLLNGTIAPVGADFSLTTPSNVFSPDGISIFQTSDGANILFRDNGYQSGEYVYGSGTFETGSEQYDWLNTVVAITSAIVSTGETSTGVALDIFLVTNLFTRG